MTYEQFCQQFHLSLSSKQQEAVRAVSGPVLLLAVPGSGKTTVLLARLGCMVCCAGIAPEQILTLTYTVAATREMASRFASLFGEELGQRMEFRTINGICAKIIGYYGELIGKKPFSLLTEEKRLTGMLSEIYRRVENRFATESDLQNIRTRITYIKNGMLAQEEIGRLEREADCKLSEIYSIYCGELRRLGLMDYDDQMVYAYRILEGSPETLRYFRNRYTYVNVDEAQDTSRIQHRIIRLLAGERDNLFLVGDEDQSIYGFRAACPAALLSFGQDHPGGRVLLMEDNYRSNGKIVAAADQFIKKNIQRHEKHMKALREEGGDIEGILLKERRMQYACLAKVARECQTKSRGRTAVLYRDNESVLPLVDLLERERIPYRIRSGELTFFTHRVVLDIRNIIEFAHHPADTELFLQIYYKIATYISKENALRICEISSREGMDVLDAAIKYGKLPEKTRQSCRAIKEHLVYLRSDQAWVGLGRIIRYMGYHDYLERISASDGKLFILRAIARGEDSLLAFLERLDELREILREKRSADECGFILSTIHASKGLEYDTVYLMDVADGIFPETAPKKLYMDREEREAYEEERRLFYVAVTRARNRLCIFRFGQESVFYTDLTEKAAICEKAVDPADMEPDKMTSDRMGADRIGPVGTRIDRTGTGRTRPGVTGADGTGRINPDRTGADGMGTGIQPLVSPLYLGQCSAPAKAVGDQEAYDRFRDGLGEGLAVRHKKWGEGAVIEVAGDKVSIRFGEQTRTFDLRVLFAHNLLECQAMKKP